MRLLSLAALSLLTVASGQSPQCGYACNDLTPGWDCDSTPNCNVCWGQVCVSQAVADAANANASLVHKERPLAASGQSLRGQGSPVCNGTQTPFCTDHFFHHPTNNCTTSSQLSPGDCEAWVDIWDGLNGPDWGYAKEGGTGGCSDERYRLDPCACQFQNSEFMNGVICRDNRITQILLSGNNLKGSLRPSLANLTALVGLFLDTKNEISGTLPAFNFDQIHPGVCGWNGGGPAQRCCDLGASKDRPYNFLNFSCPLPAGAAEHCGATCWVPPTPAPTPAPTSGIWRCDKVFGKSVCLPGGNLTHSTCTSVCSP